MSKKKPTFWQIVLSTLAAAFGVQSRKAHERDAGQNSVAPYIVAGLIFTAVFIITIVTVVKIVLSLAAT